MSIQVLQQEGLEEGTQKDEDLPISQVLLRVEKEEHAQYIQLLAQRNLYEVCNQDTQ